MSDTLNLEFLFCCRLLKNTTACVVGLRHHSSRTGIIWTICTNLIVSNNQLVGIRWTKPYIANRQNQ